MIASAADGLHNQTEALNQTVHACDSVEEWEASYAQYSLLWMYTADAHTVLTNMCLYSSEVTRTPLCNDALTVP